MTQKEIPKMTVQNEVKREKKKKGITSDAKKKTGNNSQTEEENHMITFTRTVSYKHLN